MPLKRSILFSSILCLILGVLCGLLLPAPWQQQASPMQTTTFSSGTPSTPSPKTRSDASTNTADLNAFDPNDNLPLLNAAYQAALALKNRDYTSLSLMAHPVRGVTFTPYSTVDPNTDVTLSADQIRNLERDSTVYTWGFVDGRGSLIELTIPQYLSKYVFNVDYTQAPHISIDYVVISGNALENVTEAYPGCRFVDFCFHSIDPVNEGLDWCSLKLVFEPGQNQWNLVGVIHGEWTI